MVNHCISVESALTSNKQKEQSAAVKQNERFAGIAEKKNRCPVNSIQPNQPDLSESDIFNDHDQAEVQEGTQPKINE